MLKQTKQQFCGPRDALLCVSEAVFTASLCQSGDIHCVPQQKPDGSPRCCFDNITLSSDASSYEGFECNDIVTMQQ